MDPVGTLAATINAVIHPVDTVNFVSQAIADSFERDMIDGDAYSRSHWVSYALGNVGIALGTRGHHLNASNF